MHKTKTESVHAKVWIETHEKIFMADTVTEKSKGISEVFQAFVGTVCGIFIDICS